jgi:phage tail-like protein
MPPTIGNTRLDPYKDFRIRLHNAGRSYTATMTTGLQSLGEVAEYRPGNDAGNSVRSPGPGHKYESIPLTRGVTPNSSFSQWASGLTLHVKETSPAPYRELYVDFFNEAGQKLASFRLSENFIFEIPIHPRGNPRVHVLRSPSGVGLKDQLSDIFDNCLRRMKT